MTAFAGVFHVLVTPFAEDGAVDAAALRRLVTWAVEAGATGLTALAVNGEAAFLDDDERELVARTVLAAAGGAVPVVLGVSSAHTATAAARTARAAELGAAAALIAAPPRAERLADHVGAAAATGLDLVVQDYPASGHEPVAVEALAALIAAEGAVKAVKAEDPPTAAKVAALARLAPEVSQLTGLGGRYLLAELRAGAAGAMTGFAFPELLVAIVEAARAGEWEQAERAYHAALPALEWESQPAVALARRKQLLVERGVLPCARLRAPGPVPASAAAEARAVAERLGAAA